MRASVDIRAFRGARHFAAWLGLVPKQYSTGGKPLLGSISKRGDGYLRRLLVHGAQAVLRWHRAHPNDRRPWLDELLRRRPVNVVAVAIANKNAQTIWGLRAVSASVVIVPEFSRALADNTSNDCVGKRS